jgi:hypothetical protein
MYLYLSQWQFQLDAVLAKYPQIYAQSFEPMLYNAL